MHMTSNILLFICYSIAVAIITNLIKKQKNKRLIIAISSTAFYLLCDWKYFVVLLIATIWSYYVGRTILSTNSTPKHSQKRLILGILPILILLIFFKWFKFIPNIALWNSFNKLILPLGLSYYSFKIISYLVDIYKRKTKPTDNFLDYYNYIAFFPQILCGPIARVEELGTQLKNLKTPRPDQVEYGIYLILSGLFKKIVIADRVVSYVNTIFDAPNSYPSIALWTAAFLYTIEIYCDFAGYSEIVVGICNLMGIYCSNNFNRPYFSYSIADFWHKWHISLSNWLRDYVYIPLGGNRNGYARKTINILITFLISGLWHGEGLTFIIWGLWHGILNIIPIKEAKNIYARIIQSLSTFICVMLGWIMFNASSVGTGFEYIKLMFVNFRIDTNSIVAAILPFTNDYSCLAYIIVIIELIMVLAIFELIDAHNSKKYGCNKFSKDTCPDIPYIRIIILLCCIILLGTWGQNSFIYANF